MFGTSKALRHCIFRKDLQIFKTIMFRKYVDFSLDLNKLLAPLLKNVKPLMIKELYVKLLCNISAYQNGNLFVIFFSLCISRKYFRK